MKKRHIKTVLILGLLSCLASCKKDNDSNEPVANESGVDSTKLQPLTLVASSEKQWTGIALAQNGRFFANYPNWSASHTISVAEITDTSKETPYPNAEWNTPWKEGLDPATHFICVQSVFFDKNNYLWILDPANPQREGKYLGVVPGGAKLLKVDISKNAVVQSIFFKKPVIEDNSYLNDVRIDEGKQLAYITDSNEGALVVVDLAKGKSWRVLSKHPSTKSENKVIVVEDKEYRNQQGEYPTIHSDGIALDPDRKFLYWRALTGESLYRISTNFLADSTLSDSAIGQQVERIGKFKPSDGMIFGQDGKLYLTSIEENGIRRIDGTSSTLIAISTELKWPDGFTTGSDGYLYVSASQLHLVPPPQPYKIFKVKIQ